MLFLHRIRGAKQLKHLRSVSLSLCPSLFLGSFGATADAMLLTVPAIDASWHRGSNCFLRCMESLLSLNERARHVSLNQIVAFIPHNVEEFHVQAFFVSTTAMTRATAPFSYAVVWCKFRASKSVNQGLLPVYNFRVPTTVRLFFADTQLQSGSVLDFCWCVSAALISRSLCVDTYI